MEPQDYPRTTPPSTLIVILDIHPISWSLLTTLPPAPPSEIRAIDLAKSSPTPLSSFLTTFMVYLNSHLSMRWGNQVVVYAASAGRAKLISPSTAPRGEPSKAKANMYRPFQVLDGRIEEGIREMVEEESRRLGEDDLGFMNEPSAIVSALTKALCFITKRGTAASQIPTDPTTAADQPSGAPDKNETRILVINATPGSAVGSQTESSNGDGTPGDTSTGNAPKGGGQMRGGYVGLMNCVFAAQKAKVPIDVFSLPPPTIDPTPPIFLQQAAHLTEGVYWQWNGRGGLLQYLHNIYLTPPSLRRTPFAVPPQDAVGFRAVCFCHHNTLDVGFVCSVCLSIFCEPRPVCLMCKTRFPIKSLPTLRAYSSLINPIPVPDTIVAPPEPKNVDKGQIRAPERLAVRGGDVHDAIEID
ncbi:hypothetical protein IAR50_007299 [Cryptococcus sp. DSM 104548]